MCWAVLCTRHVHTHKVPRNYVLSITSVVLSSNCRVILFSTLLVERNVTVGLIHLVRGQCYARVTLEIGDCVCCVRVCVRDCLLTNQIAVVGSVRGQSWTRTRAQMQSWHYVVQFSNLIVRLRASRMRAEGTACNYKGRCVQSALALFDKDPDEIFIEDIPCRDFLVVGIPREDSCIFYPKGRSFVINIFLR